MKRPIPRCLFLFFVLSLTGPAFPLMASVPGSSDAAPSSTNTTNVTPPTPSPTAMPSPSPSPVGTTLTPRDLPEIHGRILLPKDWTLLPGKLLEGEELLATQEKIATENDPWTTGLSMTIDRNGAKDSGEKASDYARALAREANEKAGEEATPIKESQAGPFHEVRFDFSVSGDQPLVVTEVLRANDTTGTLAVILWQNPKADAARLKELKEGILAGLQLDPKQ